MSRARIALALLIALAVPARAIRIERLLGTRTRAGLLGKALGSRRGGSARAIYVGDDCGRAPPSAPNRGLRVLAKCPIPVGCWRLARRHAVMTGVNLARGLSGVISCHPNHFYRATLTPNDPLLSSQYALTQTNAFAGWDLETGSLLKQRSRSSTPALTRRTRT